MTDTEINLRGRLTLLKEITKLSNPRFGADRMMNSVMRLLREYHRADECLFVTLDMESGQFLMRRSCAKNPDAGLREEVTHETLGRRLTSLPPTHTVSYQAGRGEGKSRFSAYCVESGVAVTPTAETLQDIEAAAALLDAVSFVTVPVAYARRGGRLYLSAREGKLNDADPEFLHQLAEHIIPCLENMRLVDKLASAAAEHERQRIARDIHDSVIQPYIGLQLGLEAVRSKLRAGGGGIAQDLDRLVEMTRAEVADLRSYMHELKSGSRSASREGSFLPAVRRFAAKFAETTNIGVDIRVEGAVSISDRLAAEVFQIVAEGLSNIRRHTVAGRAVIGINCDDECFHLYIENDGGPPSGGFLPKSIMERVAALGGDARVEGRADATTAVSVRIPL
jgi:signal transduction histidine kinase